MNFLRLLFLFLVCLVSLSASSTEDFELAVRKNRLFYKREVHSSLFQAYKRSNSAFYHKSIINFAEVEPVNWPPSVIFYLSSDWSTKDLAELAVRIPDIGFKLDWRQFPAASLEVKKSLHARLKTVALRFTSSQKLPWASVFKQKFPQLHLSSGTTRRWNGKDVFKIRMMLAYYEGDEEEAERLRQEERKIMINAALREKYSAAVGVNSFNIEWSAVQVIGWPSSVLFFNSQDWSSADIDALETSLESISFFPIKAEKFSDEERSLLFLRFLNSFGGDASMFNWEALKLTHPGVHFTCSDPSNWKPHDYTQLKQIISVQEILSDAEFVSGIEDAFLLPEVTKESNKRKIDEI